MNFINLAKGTFALFRVKVRNEEKDLYSFLAPPGVDELVTNMSIGFPVASSSKVLMEI